MGGTGVIGSDLGGSDKERRHSSAHEQEGEEIFMLGGSSDEGGDWVGGNGCRLNGRSKHNNVLNGRMHKHQV